jgi:hypothetical protein
VGSCPYEFCWVREWDERTVCAGISTSEFQVRTKVKPITLDALANSEVIDPPRVEAGNSVFSLSVSFFIVESIY